MKGRAGLLVGILVAAGAAVAVVGYARTHKKKSELAMETAKVDRGRIVARVTATGTLSAVVTVQVGSQVSGRIQQIFVNFNSPVKKGQVIAKLDPELFAAAVDQARANLVAALGNLTKARAQALEAERQYARTKTLAARELLSQADLEATEAGAEAAKGQVAAAAGAVEQMRAALRQAQVSLAYTTITSPIDGVVISRNVDVGQTVAASLQAPTLFTIAEDLGKMQVDTNVAEADVGKLAAQMAATFAVDAYPQDHFRGVISQIRNAPQTVQNVVTYDAVIDVDNSDLKLKPGMTASVTFVYAERKDVLRVPNAALRFHPPSEWQAGEKGSKKKAKAAAPAAGEQRTVWVLRDGTPTPVAVRTGVSDGNLSELLEGELEEGDRVVTDVDAAEKEGGSGKRGKSKGLL